MKRVVLLLLWLTLSASALVAQSLSFPEGLTPFQLNGVEVDQADSISLRLWGERFDGSEVDLFSGPGIPFRGGLLCYAYIDEEIRFLKGESETSSGEKLPLSAEVQRSAFRISVYGFPGTLEGRGPWQGVRSEKELGHGDIYVLSPQADPTPIIAAGIHVLSTLAHSISEQDPQNPWRGYLIFLSDPAADTVSAALESRREQIIAFKQRYEGLPVSLGFHGPRIPRQNPLVFPTATPAAIAHSLQVEAFRDRIGPQYRSALLAFSILAIAAVALIRRWRLLLPLIGILSVAFVSFTLVIPVKPRSLTIEFALPTTRGDSSGRTVHLESVGDPTENTFRYREKDIAPGTPKLVYRSILTPGGEAPLGLFSDEAWVRFNQIPEVRQRQGLLFLKFRNPLSAWSLHEP